MSLTDEKPEANGHPMADIRGLPRSVKICFLSSTIGLILLEWEWAAYLRPMEKSHIVLAHPWFYPVLIFAPWAWSMWGVLQIQRLARHNRIHADVTRLMEYIAGMPTLSYLLAWQWSEFILAVSKPK